MINIDLSEIEKRIADLIGGQQTYTPPPNAAADVTTTPKPQPPVGALEPAPTPIGVPAIPNIADFFPMPENTYGKRVNDLITPENIYNPNSGGTHGVFGPQSFIENIVANIGANSRNAKDFDVKGDINKAIADVLAKNPADLADLRITNPDGTLKSPTNTSPVKDSGDQIGTINTDIIKDAIDNLPKPNIKPSDDLDKVLDGIDESYGQDQVEDTIDDAADGSLDGQDDPGYDLDTTVDPSGNDTPPQDGGGGFDWKDLFKRIVLAPRTGGSMTNSFDPTSIDDWIDWAANSATGSSSNTNTNNNSSSSGIGDILSGGISSAINFYGNDQAAKEYGDAARYTADKNKELFDIVTQKLDPYWNLGNSAIPGALDAAKNTPSSANLPGYSDSMAIDPNINIDTGISDEQLRSTVFQGLEGLPDIQGDTGAIPNLITEGSDAYEKMVSDATDRAANYQVAKGKLGSGETNPLMAEAFLGALDKIEGINSSRTSQELARRGSDYNITSGKRGQLAGEQLAEADTEFGQLSSARDQLYKQLFGQDQATVENTLRTNDQNFSRDATVRDQLFKELMSSDSQGFEKILSLLGLGQNSGARTGAAATSLAPVYADAAGANAVSGAARTQNTSDLLQEIVNGIFG